MGTHGSSSKSKKSSSSRRRSTTRQSDDDDSASDSPDQSDSSRDSSPSRRSSKRRRSRRRRSSSRDSEDSGSSDDGSRRRGKRSSSKKVTDEEIAEYLAKKAKRKALKVAKKLKTQRVSGYSNDGNPFGDPNLNETENAQLPSCSFTGEKPYYIYRLELLYGDGIRRFVWGKKIERDVTQGASLDTFSVKAEKKRQKERMAEIEKVKKRREERAIEKAQHEEEMALLARERARAEVEDWEKKEEEFHFEQSKVRSEIRLREGRLMPIDILTKQINPSDDFDIEISEPYMIFKGLTVREMEQLREEIKMHRDSDQATTTHIEYWEALLVVCDWELAEIRKKEALDRATVRGEDPPAELLAEERGLHSSIEADVRNHLQGKTYRELEALQSDIESDMRSGKAKVVEYWEALLKRLHIYKAKACLREIHTQMLRKHLALLEQPGKGKDTKLVRELSLSPKGDDSHDDTDAQAQAFSPEPIPDEETHEVAEEYDGSYSPQLLHGSDAEEAIDPEEDKAILELKRKAVLDEQQRRIKEAMSSRPTAPVDDLEINARKRMGPMEDGDAIFGSNNEISLDNQVYWWHDKYRPRKPKYFNRVHTGYEWNKYNQTHYDHDNPPPKVVQGYKFNIFYPDLVDKTNAPTYTIEKDGESADTCVIRFHAGPPYEDMAFRIVNKEWEYSHKKGFKCTFERGILHLYFNFKRYRYRR